MERLSVKNRVFALDLMFMYGVLRERNLILGEEKQSLC
jgi:hypothetical protein